MEAAVHESSEISGCLWEVVVYLRHGRTGGFNCNVEIML